MKKIAVLISESGSNLEAIAEACRTNKINGKIVCVISNNPDAYGFFGYSYYLANKDKIKAAKAQMKVAEEGIVKEDRDYEGMSHGILAVAAKADGEGMAQIAGMLGVDVGEYDLDDDGDLDDLYDDIETALGRVSTAEVEQLYNELRKLNLVEGHERGYTFGVGDIVKNKNTSCPHYGSKGIVQKRMDLANKIGKVAVYRVVNKGATYKPGDVLTKTMDQLEQYNG